MNDIATMNLIITAAAGAAEGKEQKRPVPGAPRPRHARKRDVRAEVYSALPPLRDGGEEEDGGEHERERFLKRAKISHPCK